MRTSLIRIRPIVVMASLAVTAFAGVVPARGHCDTLDGPVVRDARQALGAGDVTPVLKWVGPGDEAAIRDAFSKTIAVRGAGPQARDLADTWFFETLVRIHRAGEGAPYTGLRPAGSEIGPAIAGADGALEAGSADALVKLVTEEVAAGIRERFARALETKKKAGRDVEAGREFVAAYVEYVHYVERLHADATQAAARGHRAGEAAEPEHEHHSER